MTNKVFKNYHKNKILLDFVNENMNLMCIVLLTAHKLYPKIMYPKAIRRFITSREEYCKIAENYEHDDVFDYKMQQACAETGINTEDCVKIVKRYMKPMNSQFLNVLVNNLKLTFVQLNNEHGLGQERRARLISALLSDEAESDRPLERIKEYGAEIDVTTISQVDYKQYRRKPERISCKEQKQAVEALQWLKTYQDSILKGGD